MAKLSLMQKRNVLRALSQKAMRGFTYGLLSMKDAETIDKIAKRNLNKLNNKLK